MTVIKIQNSTLCVLIIILLFTTNCKEQVPTERGSNFNQIISLLVNHGVDGHPYRMTFLPRFDEYDQAMSKDDRNQAVIERAKRQRELFNKELVVVIDTTLHQFIEPFTTTKLSSNNEAYRSLYDELLLMEASSFKIDDLTPYGNYNLLELTSEHKKEMKRRRDYETFDLLMSFSNIVYSTNNDQAVVAMSSYVSSLAGWYAVCFLSKVNGHWKIVGFQNISIS
jgi:hypothetical protein